MRIVSQPEFVIREREAAIARQWSSHSVMLKRKEKRGGERSKRRETDELKSQD